MGSTAENLAAAAQGENYEWTDMYEGFAKTVGMLFLIVRGLEEQGGDLLIALLLGLGSEICILVSRLGFAGKGRFQVLFSSAW